MVEEIKEKFTGKWKMDRTENFDQFLQAIGMNRVVRKIASVAKPENDIRVEDDGTIVIVTSSAVMKNEQRFKVGEEFEETNTFVKKKFKNMPVYEDGKLRVTPTPVEPTSSAYPEYSERELTDAGEMLITVKINDVVCKRWFKKVR